MKKVLLAFLLVFAQQALANCTLDHVVIEPANPFTYDDAEVRIAGLCSSSATPYLSRVEYDLRTIRVHLENHSAGIEFPTPWGERFKLAHLRQGPYELVVMFDGDDIGGQSFVVRERPFNIAPNFGGPGTEVVITEYPLTACAGEPCPDLEVFFGSERAEYRESDMRLVAIVPDDVDSGDVTLKLRDGRTIVFNNAFAFGQNDPSFYERVLFPSIFTGRGAHGSDWHTDLVIRNDSPATVATVPLFRSDPTLPIVPPLEPLPPGEEGHFPEQTREGGAFFYVPRGLESSFAYASHVVDRSRSATDLGSEVPVVRAEDTSHDIRLPAVPVDPRYRAKLRVYDYDGNNDHRALLTVRNAATGAPLATFWLDLNGSEVCGSIEPCFPQTPAFAVVDLERLEQVRGVPMIDVELRGETNDTRLWAFVSVTNNETQSITLHTPQHKRPAK